MDEVKAVEYIHTAYKVQNLADGGFRFTFDVPNSCKKQAAWMLEKASETGILLRSVTAIENLDEKTTTPNRRKPKQRKQKGDNGM